ncbi:HEAT repeat domain-containing protein [Leptospira idonii]|uniref:HEAT repeat domain-containing protein n=1 Tax=Leptospira idonii TaxID=1193500 RepID=A0A4R9M2K7_9LEPT|nr:HEAT repeat domain-containing protein [Leptospira idonii]TGN19018.1 hypothetical protein EHS15_11455 [Leptospira idonii]
MNRNVFLYILIFFSFSLSAQNANKEKAKQIYDKIPPNVWLEEKKNLGVSLGRIGKDAEAYIHLLFKADSYWDRLAGVSAASVYSSDSIDSALVQLHLTDHMVERETKDLIASQPKRFSKFLYSIWNGKGKKEDRSKVLYLLAESDASDVISLLKKESSDLNSEFRETAFSLLTDKKNFKDEGFIRSFLEDKKLRLLVLQHIYETGSPSDKTLMYEILRKKKSEWGEFTIAISAIKKWGKYSEQESEYYKTLTEEKDESKKQYAIHLLGEIRSEAIRKELCELAGFGAEQELRLVAAETLVPYQDIGNRPCLKRIIKEKYESRRRSPDVIDVFATIITAGFSNIIQGMRENKSQSDFLGRQNEIKKHLQFLELKAEGK